MLHGSVGTGGTVAFTTAFKSFTVSISGNTGNKAAGGTVANHTLSTARIPAHSHSGIPTTQVGGAALYVGTKFGATATSNKYR